jgi:hypothetical protein
MFVIPAIAALLTFVYLRPHEVVELLRPLTLGGVVGIVGYTYVLDLRLGKVRPRGSPILYLLLALLVLCVFTIVVRAPDRLTDQLIVLGPSMVVFLAVSEGIQSFRAFEAGAIIVFVLTIFLAIVGVHQGLQPMECFVQTGHGGANAQDDLADGRPCTRRAQCEEGDVTGADYLCEHPGLMGTHSDGGRVRYRGVLEDPNELCMALALGLPLALGLYERRRTWLRRLLVVALFATAIPCVVMSQSRSGQISMIAVLGVYFMRRFGRRGIVVAAVLAVPLLVLGGRSGEEAAASSEERLECWAEAFSMWRENPFLGVGQGQFREYHYLTAHNSLLLALAELGPGGLFLFSAAFYTALKVAVRAQLDFAARSEAEAARIWGTALTASLVGVGVSAFFLSLTYHPIVWMLFGLTAAFYAAIRKHDPTWRVRFGLRDAFIVAATDIGVVGSLWVYLRLRGV